MKPESIVQTGDPVLRAVATPVPEALFGTSELTAILERMSSALAACPDGVALAAPQIGLSLRIFVIAGKVFARRAGADESEPVPPDEVYINPTITRLSKKTKTLDEGCLSVRGLYGSIERAERATVEAYDHTGTKFTRHGSGFIAQIFQHEVDHLNGILFTDTAHDVYQPDTHDAT